MGAKQVGLDRVGGLARRPGERRGSPEHSIKASIGSIAASASALRTSPRVNATPAASSRGRLSSEPRRWRLSSAISSQSGWRSASAVATLAPTKPAPPVIRTLNPRHARRSLSGHTGSPRPPFADSAPGEIARPGTDEAG